jgi:3-methyladenine DNA glycosylase AlkD
MARFGIDPCGRLGVSIPDVRRLARETGRSHALALALWKTGIADARILAAMVDEPRKATAAQMERWVRGFDSWDVCDQVCLNLFVNTPSAWEKAREWAGRDREFVRRAGFALMACLAVHDKKAPDSAFVRLLPLIRRVSTDDRNYVRKAVNWALRQIGKRNRRLNRTALAAARRIAALDSRSARWIASDAIRELESAAVRRRLKG